jgi:hypothetical protein
MMKAILGFVLRHRIWPWTLCVLLASSLALGPCSMKPAHSAPAQSVDELFKLSQLQPAFREKVERLLEITRAHFTADELMVSETFRPQKRQDMLFKKGKHVTTVKKSKHTLGLAVDIYFVKNGKILDYGKAPYDEMGEIAESLDMTWGGRWKVPFDPGHFEEKSK